MKTAPSHYTHPYMIELIERRKHVASLEYAIRLMNWDSYTYLPPRGSHLRGEVVGQFHVMKKEFLSNSEFLSTYEKAAQLSGLNAYEQGSLRKIDREIQKYNKLPTKFLEDFSQTISLSLAAWETARKTGDTSNALTYINKSIDLQLQKADILGFEEHPYNSILDEFEPGFTTHDYDTIFSNILPTINTISNNITYNNLPIDPFRERICNKVLNREESQKIVHLLKKKVSFPNDMFRVDETQHPFSEGISNRDVRMGLKLENIQLKHLYHHFLHEFGHSTYDASTQEALGLTPLVLGSTLGLHESQSRFWELCVGHDSSFLSETFKEICFLLGQDAHPHLHSLLPSLLALTLSKSPLRAHADELHYHTHVYIRYEIEKALLQRKLHTSELPKRWNDMYHQYLDVTPANYQEGFLQDIHRREGLFGYFPTYTLGTALAYYRQHIVSTSISTTPNISGTASLSIDSAKHILHTHLGQYGSTYITKEIIEKVGVPFDTHYMNQALQKKYALLSK